jgi:hypothetical protein
MVVFCDVAPCSLVDIDRRFRGTCYLHYQGDGPIVLMMEALSTFETSVNIHQTAQRNIPEDSRPLRNKLVLRFAAITVCNSRTSIDALKQRY